jgi:hypothetical protein
LPKAGDQRAAARPDHCGADDRRREQNVPAVAALLLLFPLWGILHPRTHRLVDLLPLGALAWLCLGFLAEGLLRAWSPSRFGTMGKVFVTTEELPQET